MPRRRKVGNLLALGLLGLLASGTPMHPYQMATLLRRTGKEQQMQIKWGALYPVGQNLEKHGFIEATGSDREGRRPERTVYAITDAGRAELRDWLHELVGVPEPELSRFEAALSVLGVLPPDEAIALLEERLRALEASVAEHRTLLDGARPHIARIFLIESECALAMREAEASWVRSLVKELADGTLPGIDQWREYHRTGRPPAEWTQLLAEGDAKTD